MQKSLHEKEVLGIGVDGCRGGWLAAIRRADQWDFVLYPVFDSLLEEHPGLGANDAPETGTVQTRLLIDMPIGLPHAGIPVRPCDREARKRLGPRRASVFSPPCREALIQSDHARASAVNREVTGRGLSIQAWNIAPRIREVDQALREGRACPDRVLECHPELFFAALLGGPAVYAKRSGPGREERGMALTGLCRNAKDRIKEAMRKFGTSVAWDDCADAMVLALAGGQNPLICLGSDPKTGKPPRDAAGLPVTIHAPEFLLQIDPR